MSDDVRRLVDGRWGEYGIGGKTGRDAAADGQNARTSRPLRQLLRR
jgi:hypothetical protein